MKYKKIFSGITVAIGMFMAAQAQDWNGGGSTSADLWRDGNVGIGLFTNPAFKLELDKGDMNILGGYGIRFDGTYGIRLAPSSTTDFILGNGGNFGIGITPVYKLDVDGDVNMPSANAYKINGTNVLAYKPTGNNLFLGPTNPLSLSTGIDNLFLGLNAGNNTTTGYFNIIIGKQCANDNTSGFANVFIGNYAARNNISGYKNVVIGNETATNIRSGYDNTILGTSAGYWARFSTGTTLVGSKAAFDPITDSLINLTAIGSGAGDEQTVGSDNSYVGIAAGVKSGGTFNLALGSNSGNEVNGVSNISIGTSAGYQTTGQVNIAIGSHAQVNPNIYTEHSIAIGGFSYVYGQESIAVGGGAGIGSGTGSTVVGTTSGANSSYSSVFGYGSGVTGDHSTALGSRANVGLGSLYSTALGSQSHVGDSSDYSIAIGAGSFVPLRCDYNTLIGAHTATAGNTNYSQAIGSYAALGEYSDYTQAIGPLAYTNVHVDYSTALGANSYVSSSYSTVLGDIANSHVGIQVSNPTFNLEVNGTTYSPGGVWTASDKRFKKNITTLSKARTLLNQLEPLQYEYRDDVFYTQEKGDQTEPTRMRFPEGSQYGFLAQDLEKVLPNAVMTRKDGYKAVNYQNLIPVMVQGIQEQDKAIEEGQKKIADLETSLAEMKEQNKLLVDAIAEIKAKLNITAANTATDKTVATKAYLEQNSPNPFSENTVVKYFIPETVTNAKIIIRSEQAIEVLSFGVNHKGFGNVIISANTLNTGGYTCELYIENKLVDTKKMLLVK